MADTHKGAYTLTGIDPQLWRRVKTMAALNGMTIREWILATLDAQSLLIAKGSGKEWDAARTGVPIRGKAYLVVRDPRGGKKS